MKPTGAPTTSSPRLLVTRRERPLTQEVELVLVEAALQPQQQPVVALPRRMDGLLIDQQRVDEAAHLDELLPVAAVAREPRDLPGRHRADLAQADLGDHALEARARGPARRRAAEVLVGDLDLGPAQLHEPVAHGVLQHLTLVVVLDPMGRGPADIEHRLARLVPCGNLPSAHRRRSPAAARCRRRGRPTGGSSARSLLAVSALAGRSTPALEATSMLGAMGRGRVGGPAFEADNAGGAWRSPRWQSGDAICGSGDDTADVRFIVSDRRDRSVRSAGRAAAGPSDARIDRQSAASSIQTGISWTRSAAASTRPHRADTPVVRSITSRT